MQADLLTDIKFKIKFSLIDLKLFNLQVKNNFYITNYFRLSILYKKVH